MEYITRKTMLYKTGVEYGDYTMNHVLGCTHGCKYPCYAFMLKKRFGQIESYDEWIKPKIVSNTLELLDKEIPRLKNKTQSVQLCFATDPFMYGVEEIISLSLAAIKKLNDAQIKVSVLTKGILPAELSEFSKANEYGISLISLDEDYRKKIEPGAAPYLERIESLKILHDAGCKTWISMEPYPTPNLIEQNLTEILSTVEFVDKIIFGRTNYSKKVSAFATNKEFYNECAALVLNFCRNHSIACHIKHGTIN